MPEGAPANAVVAVAKVRDQHELSEPDIHGANVVLNQPNWNTLCCGALDREIP